MADRLKSLRVCEKGHRYYKSSDCPVCPICESQQKPSEGFLSELSAPARRALQEKGITSLKELADWSQAEILALHGVGPRVIPRLESLLKEAGLSFRAENGK
jgi:predicted RecB family nuclease